MQSFIKNIYPELKKEWGLCLILALYLGLVFYNFSQQGLVNWDESYFAVVAGTYGNILRTALTHPLELFSSGYFENLRAAYGNVYTVAKPSFILTASLFNLFWPNPDSLRLVSVVAGLGVLILFNKFLAFYSLSKNLRWLAVFLLAVSPLFLIYARVGLAPMFSAFFLLLAFYYFIKFDHRGRTKDLVIGAAALAILLMSHYSTFFIVGLILFFGLILLGKKKKKIGSYGAFAAGFLALPLIWEIITRIGARIAVSRGLVSADGLWGVFPYSREIMMQLAMSGNKDSFSFFQFDYYFKLLWSQEGAIFFILLCLGALVFLRNIKRVENWLVLAPLVLFIGVLSLGGLKFPRTLMPVFPLFYLLFALGLKFVWLLLKKLKIIFPARAGILIIILLLMVWPRWGNYQSILNVRTPFKEFVVFIKDNYQPEKTLLVSAMAPLWRVYLPGYKIEELKYPERWQHLNDGRKVLVIADYFAAINSGVADPLDFPKRAVKAGETNLFSVLPLALDFAYGPQDVLDKYLNDINNRRPAIYEADESVIN